MSLLSVLPLINYMLCNFNVILENPFFTVQQGVFILFSFIYLFTRRKQLDAFLITSQLEQLNPLQLQPVQPGCEQVPGLIPFLLPKLAILTASHTVQSFQQIIRSHMSYTSVFNKCCFNPIPLLGVSSLQSLLKLMITVQLNHQWFCTSQFWENPVQTCYAAACYEPHI